MSTVNADDQSLFKLPPIPKKKKKKNIKILDEDAYLDEMGNIIERDFFPDLKMLKAQNEYLDAQNENDILKLREITSKYSIQHSEPYSSPATFETPIDKSRSTDDFVNDEETKIDKEKKDNEKTKHSLDQYLCNHTSEDNKSFEDILKESERQHRLKHSWMYKEDSSANDKLKGTLALEAAPSDGRPFELDTWAFKDRNYIMYVPDGVDMTAEEKVELAKRKQEIIHSNTRLKVNPFDEHENKERILDLAQTQAKTLDGKIGVDGKVVVVQTPKVNGFSFVKTPSPAPGVNETPLMTWGEIEGTPFRLDSTPLVHAPFFHMPKPPKRECLALQLADKAGERHRDRKKKAMEAARRQLTSPAGRPSSDRLQMLSPAARRLASSRLQRVGSDKRLSAYYSPRTSPKPSHLTPSFTPPVQPQPTLLTTDNLLNLNVQKRPRAVDFFA